MSHQSGSRALIPKIPLTDFNEIYNLTDKKELFNEFYEFDENDTVNKMCLLKSNEIRQTAEEIEKLKEKKKELLEEISKVVKILFEHQIFDLNKRNHYISPSNTFPGYK